MRAALTDATGLVVNIVLIGEDYEPPDHLAVTPLENDSPVGPGWSIIDGLASEPPEAIPPDLPPTQLEVLQAQVDELTDLILMGGL